MVESTLIASVFSASKSPRVILRSISSMIAALLRPLTKTLFFVPEMFSQGISGGQWMRGNIHISQSCNVLNQFPNQKSQLRK